MDYLVAFEQDNIRKIFIFKSKENQESFIKDLKKYNPDVKYAKTVDGD